MLFLQDARETVISSLTASFFAEGIAHPEDAGTLAPRDVLPEEYRTLLLRPVRYQGSFLLETAVKHSKFTRIAT